MSVFVDMNATGPSQPFMGGTAREIIGGSGGGFTNPTPRWARYQPTRNLKAWGLGGVGRAGLRGAKFAFGFESKVIGRSPAGLAIHGPSSFLGGRPILQTYKSAGVGFGVGYAAYAATGNAAVGLAAGIGANYAMRGTFGGMMTAAMPVFTAMSIIQGYKEEGVWGGIKAGVSSAASFAAWEIGMSAISTAAAGTGIGAAAAGIATVAAAPLAAAAAIGYGTYKGAQFFANRGREALQSEFAANTESIYTQPAYSMRMRALNEIQRSHANTRSALGQEASLMHM